LQAQAEAGDAPSVDESFFDGLRQCRQISDDNQRLACFDRAVGPVIAASEEGEVRIVTKDEAAQTRRSLFGFNLPKIAIFGSDDEDEDDLFETRITSARYLSSKKARFVTEEGAVWELLSIPSRLRPLSPGDTVRFKKASMGTYFARINGQLGVRAKRVE
jgi:hypothetical protein